MRVVSRALYMFTQNRESVSEDPEFTDTMAQMRTWLVNSVIQSEAAYIEDLDVLLRVCGYSR